MKQKTKIKKIILKIYKQIYQNLRYRFMGLSVHNFFLKNV